jgi:23S rRNA (uracil1939-C5)-methyltransferase
VRRWIGSTRTALRRVTIATAPGGVAVGAIAATRPADGDRAACERALAADAGLRGIVVAGGGSRLVAGDPSVRVELEPGLDLEVPIDAFTQVNAGANRSLIETAIRFANPRAGTRALDLYCGAGNFTLPFARRGVDVLGIERSAVAVEAGRANATRHGLRATFREAGVAAALATIAPGSIDTVVLDPPRAGAADAIAGIAALRPGRIVYVSCDPATLARDARALTARGSRLVRVQPVDLFPQTYHVESVAEFNC